MAEFLQRCLTLPTVIPTVLLGFVCIYWVLMILSGLDLDVFDLDLDMDPGTEVHDSFLDWGIVGLKRFNLGHVPLMVWMSVFALTAWLMSVIFDKGLADPAWSDVVTASLRDFGVALFAAKLFTQPLKDKFKIKEPHTAEDMLGGMCVITTSEATPEFGQAKYSTDDGAPLLLTVHTTQGVIPQGAEARIVDYSPEQQV
ncbi:MAG: hypothetical protein AB7Q45_02400, partial [Planctomycetaceae bacterium]